MTIGNSLARGLVKRWSREMLEVRRRISEAPKGIATPKHGAFLKQLTRKLSRIDSPWLLLPPLLEGKRRRARVTLTLLLPEDGEFVARVMGIDAFHLQEAEGPLRITEHGLQRIAQSCDGDCERIQYTILNMLVAVSRHVNDGDMPRDLSIVSQPSGDIWHLDLDPEGGFYHLRTVIASEAIGGRRAEVIAKANGRRIDSDRPLFGRMR